MARIEYCCKFPNLSHFQDTNGGHYTAVVFCNACQRILSELWFGEEE